MASLAIVVLVLVVVLVLEVLPVREPRNEDCRINSNDGLVILCGVATQLEDDDEYEEEISNAPYKCTQKLFR